MCECVPFPVLLKLIEAISFFGPRKVPNKQLQGEIFS